jgi:uncharacterized damage-inducible protein DinB
MSVSDEIRAWYAYNSNVRKKYLEAFEKLSPDELKKDRGASFPSLIEIVHHTLEAYEWWFTVFLQNNGEDHPLLTRSPDDLASLKQYSELVDREVHSYLSGVSDELLDKVVTRDVDTENGKRRISLVLKWVLWHMVEEELQHRGELNALLWQLNVDPPVTGWDDWMIERRNQPKTRTSEERNNRAS